jgi:hypothetical protein
MKALMLVMLITILLTMTVSAQETAVEPGRETTTAVTTDEAAVLTLQDTQQQGFSLHLESISLTEPQSFAPLGPISLASEREFRAALWDSPLGRVHYHLASEQAMLGREGLVHGGHMLGLGMATTAIGDAPTSGIGLMVHGTPWSQLSTSQRVRSGFDIAISAGILYAIVQGID